MRHVFRLIPAALLGVGAAVLVSCGGSGKGLIPVANAGPLKSDFQEVVNAAQAGNGDCTATEAKIHKTERDLEALPSSIDGGLRGRLAEGVDNLAARARVLCSQPLAQTSTTTTTPTAPPAQTTPTQTTSTTPPPAATTPSSTTPSEEEGGGTQAPNEGHEEEGGTEAETHGNGVGQGEGGGRDNGLGGADAGAGSEPSPGEVNGGTGSAK